jgi:hypothetical protein
LLLLFVCLCNAAGNTRYVAENGVDSATCGAARKSPCKSLQGALKSSKDNVDVVLAPGIYKGSGIIKRIEYCYFKYRGFIVVFLFFFVCRKLSR